MKRVLITLLFISIFSVGYSRVLVWNKAPLNIVLPVSKQIYVSFPESVKVGLNSNLLQVLDVQNANDTLYLTAKRSFKPVQIKLRTANNKIIFINLSAQEKASTEPVQVIYTKPVQKSDNPFKSNAVSMQDLIQYTVQQYYAPKRLLSDNPNIQESMRFHTKNYKLFADDSITAIPLNSYTSGSLTVTAIYLKNNLPISVNLIDPNTQKPIDICGNWTGSIFFPISKLSKAGTAHDSSMLFLLSKNDFISVYKSTCDLESINER
ncbi:DUF3438 family protein [Francisella sp. SYW-9]|uniref:DUF3438 family protein n=1 Tax=Francisella sp. SYW-9 TaxID=2610888 RepID=UPI00123E29D7|nr:DUF3438 family protein [Francisella sp. SYW-9]